MELYSEGQTEYWKKILSQYHLSIINPIWSDLGLILCVHRGKPATKCLNYDTDENNATKIAFVSVFKRKDFLGRRHLLSNL
jgi:hypothetical protein